MGRAPCCDKANVKKGPWSAEEDAKLKAYIEEHGTGGNWIALPQKIGLKRCGKSCRLRWLNYLRPNIKHGGFTEEEDQIICSLYISIGSRWSIIAAQLPGRTDNDIKNYWNTRLKKKLLGKRRNSSQSRRLHLNSNNNQVMVPNEQGSNGEKDVEEAASQTLSASALERMQLHMQLQGLCSTATNPFSFYTNPALWPKFHPLVTGDQIRVQENEHPHSNIISSNFVPQVSGENPINSTLSGENPINSTLKLERSAAIQEHCPGLGFHSPLSGGSLSVENSSSNVDSLDAGVQADLQSLFYCKSSSSFAGNDEHKLAELDSYRESTDWWPCNGYEDRSMSMTPWDCMMVNQDCVLRYEDLQNAHYS